MPINQTGWEQAVEIGPDLTHQGERNFRSKISTSNTCSGSSSLVNAVTNGNRLNGRRKHLSLNIPPGQFTAVPDLRNSE